MSKWSVMCTKCGKRAVVVEVEARRTFKKSYFYGYGRKDVLAKMTSDEINARTPIEFVETVWTLPPIMDALCRECRGGKKGLSV